MAGLALLLVIGFLALVWYSLIYLFINCGKNLPDNVSKEPTERQIEKDRLKTRMKLRNLRAEIMRWYLNHPKYKDNLKFLIRKELEVAQMLKGLKRRTISDIKYEAISKAAKSGKFNKEVLDMINQ